MNEVQLLATEIGSIFRPENNSLAFRARWVHSLAQVVGADGRLHACPYREKIAAWVWRIGNATDPEMDSVLRSIRDEIEQVDSDDGWATDPTGSALEAVCLCLLPKTRWMAEAGQRVWGYATGSGCAYNQVIKVSRDAWLRHLYEACAVGVGIAV